MPATTICDIEKALDTVVIENSFEHAVYISIHPRLSGQYDISIEFLSPGKNAIEYLAVLYKLSKTLQFTSRLIEREHLDITHIFVTRHAVDLSPSVQWDCISKPYPLNS